MIDRTNTSRESHCPTPSSNSSNSDSSLSYFNRDDSSSTAASSSCTCYTFTNLERSPNHLNFDEFGSNSLHYWNAIKERPYPSIGFHFPCFELDVPHSHPLTNSNSYEASTNSDSPCPESTSYSSLTPTLSSRTRSLLLKSMLSPFINLQSTFPSESSSNRSNSSSSPSLSTARSASTIFTTTTHTTFRKRSSPMMSPISPDNTTPTPVGMPSHFSPLSLSKPILTSSITYSSST